MVPTALRLWGFDDAQWSLVAIRENHVFKVSTDDGRDFALRIHRRAFRSDAELTSELAWMGALSAGGLHVPAPIAALDGGFLHRVEGAQIDVLSWLPGGPLGATGKPLALANRQTVVHQVGVEMARLHALSDAWTPPAGFDRWSWDRHGLLGEQPVWGRFWDNPALTPEDKALFETARDHATRQLSEMEDTLDYGLIHADLVRENLILDGDRVQMIDFDDGGWGFRIFDLATFLFKNRAEPDFDDLAAACISGYQSQRAINTDALSLFMMLRALTYVGWIMDRMGEAGSEARNTRFIATARSLVKQHLRA